MKRTQSGNSSSSSAPKVQRRQSSLFQFFGSSSSNIASSSGAPALAVVAGKKASNPFSTGGGGVNFEQKVQSSFLALFLMGGTFPIMGRSDCIKVSLQSRRQGLQTDDAVVTFRGENQQEYKLLAQIKHKLTFTEKDEQAKEALEQAWVDFTSPGKFDPKNDRIVIITGALSQTLIDHLKPLFDWARTSENEKDFMNRFEENAGEKKKKLGSFRAIIQRIVKAEISDKQFWEFLKVLDILDYDLDHTSGKDEASIITQLSAHLVDRSQANSNRVWQEICAEVARFNSRAGVLTADNLSPSLKSQFIQRITPNSVWHMPTFDGNNFVGNQQYVDSIRIRFQNKQGENVVVPVYGLGGVGKSYLALKSVSSLMKNYKIVAWFNARSRASLHEQFFEFARDHSIYFEPSATAERKVEVVKNWFAKNPESLLVFDDAESYLAIKPFIPSGAHVLITSLNATSWTNGIFIEPMTKEDATHLFKQESDLAVDSEQDEDIKQLVEGLGSLPLAIAQAGAYVHATGITVQEYLRYYQQAKKRMLEDGTLRDKRGEHPSVYITFEMSFQKVGDSLPAARELLTYCSYLHQNTIPKALLAQITFDSMALNDQIAVLRQYSLIKSNTSFLGVHCVVQDVIQEKMVFENLNGEWMLKVSDLLNNAFLYDRNNRDALEGAKLLIPHMIRVKELAQQAGNCSHYQAPLGELLYKIGVFYLDYLYDAQTAEEYLKLAEPFLLVPDLVKRNNKYLLKAYSKNEKYDLAEQYAVKFEVGIETDVDVLCILGNHYLHLKPGADGHDKASSCFSKAYKIAESENNKDKMAMICHYRGTTCRYKGEMKRNIVSKGEREGWGERWIEDRRNESEVSFSESLGFYQQALSLKERIYAPNHPEVARTRHQMGVVYMRLNNYHRARGLFEEAVTSLKDFYGDEPRKNIANMLFSLGQACLGSGLLDQAEKAFEDSLDHLDRLPEQYANMENQVRRELEEVTTRKQSSIESFMSSSGQRVDAARAEASTFSGQPLIPSQPEMAGSEEASGLEPMVDDPFSESQGASISTLSQKKSQ